MSARLQDLTDQQRHARDERIRELHRQGLKPTVIQKRLKVHSDTYYKALRKQDARDPGSPPGRADRQVAECRARVTIFARQGNLEPQQPCEHFILARLSHQGMSVQFARDVEETQVERRMPRLE